MEFAKALGEQMRRHDGYQESESAVVTWCVGHLVTMSYPEVYDPALKKWSLQALPFLPDTFLYEVIPSVQKQFDIVSALLKRDDVDCIYVCTDSGREGEYIYRLVAQMAGVTGKTQKRVWIDSQTEEEILRGIREAKDLSCYDHLSDAAYLRAKEDYLMGINFSRLLTLKYSDVLSSCLQERYCVISVGRVMTCVLGMIVRREREIREFVKTPFFRIVGCLVSGGQNLECEWKAVEGSSWYQSPLLYKENGFKKREDALECIRILEERGSAQAVVEKAERKHEKKNPPLLYNLAELQNDCSRMFRISPDQTLQVAQELYEKKLITYPRTDARVLSSAVAKEIRRNLSGLSRLENAAPYVQEILDKGSDRTIGKTRYTDDKQITDHYALIPTGQGLSALKSLNKVSYGVYMTIVRRFLRIFYPPAQYLKVSLVVNIAGEKFFAGFRLLEEPGFLAVMPDRSRRKSAAGEKAEDGKEENDAAAGPEEGGKTESSEELTDLNDPDAAAVMLEAVKGLRKGSVLENRYLRIREGETSPPKRYNSGTMILAMENAGQLIEDEELRSHIKGSGIGTSATRAEILKKLISNRYIALNKKTQILTPTLMGELIFDVVYGSIRSLLNPELTASWEKGLTYVAEGTISPDEYMEKLKGFVRRRTDAVMGLRNQSELRGRYEVLSPLYAKQAGTGRAKSYSKRSGNTAKKQTQKNGSKS